MTDIKCDRKVKVADLTPIEVGEGVDLCDNNNLDFAWPFNHGWIEIRLVSTY